LTEAAGRKMGQDYEKEFFKHFESSSDPLDELFESDQPLDGYEQLGELILRFQDGVISQEQFNHLEKWILSDKKALEYYVEYAWLFAGLNILLNKKHDEVWQKSLLATRS
jgi:hypothetical protein